MIHSFGECELDDERFELRRGGTVVKLEPKVFDVLACLVRHPERVVTKAELLDTVWPGVAVSESVLPKCIAAARRAVGDTRARPRVIGTVHGRGYRLLADVRTGVAAARPAPAPPAGAPAPRGDRAYVGRRDLRARLTHALADAGTGDGRLVVLLGEAGIGKTRTAEAVLAEAGDRALGVVVARAHEGDGAPPFWPWVQVLRGIAALPEMGPWLAAGEAVAPEVSALVPELGRRGGDRLSLAGREARFRLFDGVTRVLRRAAARRPLALLLDDLHWADAGSLEILALLAAEIGRLPVLVLATCRDDEIDRTRPLADLMATLARAPACEWVTLAGFDHEETAELVTTLVASPPAGELETIHRLTGGNPFFIHELARLLAAGGAAAVADVAAMTLPPPRRVRDATRRRLDMLPADCRTALRVAAVLGQEWDAATLAAVLDLPAARVLELVGAARAAHLLDADPDRPSHYAFHHVLVRHALYEELGDAERVRWHGRAAERLAARAGTEVDPAIDALASHAFAAIGGGDAVRAVDACVRAAERAARLCAYEQSARWYERALTALDAAASRDETRRVTLLLGLGEVETAGGANDAGRAAFARAAESARALGRSDLLARAVLGFRGPAEMGAPSDPLTDTLMDEALAAVGDALPDLRARLLSRMAGMRSHAPTMERRAALAREAYALAEQSGDAQALRDALAARLWAALGPDHVSERLTVSRALLTLGQRERSLPMTLLAHDAALGAHLLRGDLDAAAHALAAYGETAAIMKQPALLFLATFWGGSLALARGDLDGAEQAFRAALADGRGAVPYAHFMYAGQMYPLRYLRGEDDDPELARIFFGEMMALPYAFEPAVRSALAFAHWLRGERAAAREAFERVVAAIDAGLERDEHWLVTVGGASRLAVLLGDAARAAALYDHLRPHADLVVVHDMLRAVGEPVASILGHLCIPLDRHDDGARHYEAALAKTAAMRAPLARIDTQLGYARLLTARRGANDETRAASLRRDATETMAALGVRRNWALDDLR